MKSCLLKSSSGPIQLNLIMKYFFFLVLLSACLSAPAQPGKFAGTKKSLIGKEYTDSRLMPGLKTWTFREGTLMNSLKDPEWFMADIFQKGTTMVVVISVKADTASDTYRIIDLIEVKGVTKGWTIHAGSCRQNKINNAWLIVWGKETNQEYMKTLKKAWRFNPDKRRVEVMPVKGVDCENIGC